MKDLKGKAFEKIKMHKGYIALALSLFLLLTVIISLVPLSGDDWEWGTFLGEAQLDNWFKDYNGRYSGNLLIIALTRCLPLRSAVIAASLCALCFLPSMVAKRKGYVFVLLSTLLLLSAPRDVISQAVFWTSGFVNYIPPILLTFVYLFLVRDAFEKCEPVVSIGKLTATSAASMVIGFVSTMFMENVTIYILVLSLGLCVLCIVRHRRVWLPAVLHLCGSLIGTVVMFTNGVYGSIFEGGDTYRTAPAFDVEDIFSHLDKGLAYLLSRSYILLLVLCLVCLWVSLSAHKRGEKERTVLCACTAVNFISVIFLCIRKIPLACSALGAGMYMLGFSLALCTGVVTVAFICIKDSSQRLKMAVCLLGVPLLIGPMLFITPFPARCLMPPYVCLVAFTVIFAGGALEYCSPSKGAVKAIKISLACLCVAVATMYLVIFSSMCHYSRKRIEYINKQIEAGYTTVLAPRLPHLSYIHIGELDKPRWKNAYKEYYGVDRNVEIVIVSRDEFNSFVKDFDKEVDDEG